MGALAVRWRYIFSSYICCLESPLTAWIPSIPSPARTGCLQRSATFTSRLRIYFRATTRLVAIHPRTRGKKIAYLTGFLAELA